MKILFHDIDGCLNSADGTPMANTEIALTALQSEGMAELGRLVDGSGLDMLVLNTGRSIAGTLPMAEAINSRKLRYLLGEHGATAFDLQQQRDVDLHAIAGASGSAEIVAAFKSLDHTMELMEWYRREGHGLMKKRLGQAPVILDKATNLTFVTPGDVAQDVMFAAILALVEMDSPFDAGEFIFHDSGSDGFVDVMSSIDKGHGVRLISDVVADGASRTFGVGNGLNDLPMMREVDMPVCPANAEPDLKEFCRAKGGHVSEHAYIQATLDWLQTGI